MHTRDKRRSLGRPHDKVTGSGDAKKAKNPPKKRMAPPPIVVTLTIVSLAMVRVEILVELVATGVEIVMDYADENVADETIDEVD